MNRTKQIIRTPCEPERQQHAEKSTSYIRKYQLKTSEYKTVQTDDGKQARGRVTATIPIWTNILYIIYK